MSDVLDLKRKARIQAPAEQYAEEEFVAEKPKRKFGAVQWIIVTVAAVVLTTVGIKASDSLFGNTKNKDNSLCPAEMVFVPNSSGGFCIDKFENAAGDKCPFREASNQEETRANLENGECQPVSREGSMPWRYISQNQAAVACAKAGKRLPTETEWQAAALATPDKQSNWTGDDCQVSDNWSQQPGAAGSGKNCVSAVGAYDMIGNVWEWVEGTVEDGKYKGSLLPDDGYVKGINSEAMVSETNYEQPDPNYYNDYFWIKKTGTRGIARGGYWGNNAEAGQYAAYVVTPPSEAGTGMGFRCAK